MVKNKLACANVISSLLKKPQLLVDDNYPLTPDDFPERFHKIVFGAIDYLVHSGAQQIDEVVIDGYLSQYPTQYKVFTDNHGVEYLQNSKEISDLTNYEYYYSQVKKCSLLSQLEDRGYNVTPFHDPDNMTADIAQKAQAKLDASSLDDILSYYDVQLSELRSMYCSSSDLVEGHISKGMRDLKNELAETPAFGLPMNSAKMNTICHGRRLRKFYLKTLPSGTGKALVNDTLIPTYDKGFMRVDQIRPGDRLIGKNGLPTTVVAIHPQPEKKQVYRVCFADGRSVDCCKDHLWTYRAHRHTDKVCTKTTEQIYNEAVAAPIPFRTPGEEGWKYKIPVCEPVQYPERVYTVPPYVMGLLLGDGSFRMTPSNRTLYYSSEDDILPSKIADIMGWGYDKNCDCNYSYKFTHIGVNRTKSNVHVDDLLYAYPDLINAYSGDKFIPRDYLFGSYEQRIALLQGLLDTDGHVDDKGRVSFCTTSPQMKKDFVELCNSLGFTARAKSDGRSKYKSGVCYDINVCCSKTIKPTLFTLPRKKVIAEAYAANGKREEYNQWLSIVHIEVLDEYKDMTCFTVDAPDALFLCNDYIVTHNTRLSMADACRLAVPEYYDPEKRRWVKTKCSESVLFITTELELAEIQTLTWAYIACVPEDHITDHKYGPG